MADGMFNLTALGGGNKKIRRRPARNRSLNFSARLIVVSGSSSFEVKLSYEADHECKKSKVKKYSMYF